MATKPFAQLSPAYQKRIARALLAGKTRQQARGHKAREHVERHERETKERGYTGSEESSIRRFYALNFDPITHPYKFGSGNIEEAIQNAPTVEQFLELAYFGGYNAWVEYREVWKAARRIYLRDKRNGTYVNAGWPYLEQLKRLTQAPDVSWLYYH